MMKSPRPYDPSEFFQIKRWLTERTNQPFEQELLPKFGQIVDGVACGFIVETNNNFALLDYYVTNPVAKFSDRIHASMVMLENALERCRLRGFQVVVANTKSRGGIRVAKRYGFKGDGVPYYCFRKHLSEGSEPKNVSIYYPSQFEMIRPWLCETANEWMKEVPLPKVGFVVKDVACIFVIETDSGVAYLDCFATNKNKPMRERLEAAKEVLCAAESYAHDMGYSVLAGSTRSVSGTSFFTQNGYAYDAEPYYFIRKTIGGVKDERRSFERSIRERIVTDGERAAFEVGEVV